MATIKDKLYFTYDNRSCRDFGLINVNLDAGMFDETLVAEREILETEVRGAEKSLFHGISEKPLEIPLILAFENGFNDEIIEEVILWLFPDVYKPLSFEEDSDKVYYCMPIEKPTIVHTGLNQGYIALTMRCNSSRIYSPKIETPLQTITSSGTIKLENKGHISIYPEISIEKVGAGHITFTSQSGEIFEIRNLTDKELIYVNCEREIIETDIIGVYRYEDVVGDYSDMELKRGMNTFTVQGSCKIRFRYAFKYKF